MATGKGGYDSPFPVQIEHSPPAGLFLTPGTWHKIASFCDWKSLTTATCCCLSLEQPIDFKPYRECILSCKGPAEYPGIKRRPDPDDDSEDGSDNSEDPDDFPDTKLLFLQSISSVNLPFIQLQSNGLLEITDMIHLDMTQQSKTVLDQRCLSDESLHQVRVLKTFVDTIRMESTLTHITSGNSFLHFSNLRALTVRDARWLRPVVLCNTKLYNLECLALSFWNSWDEGDPDQELTSFMQQYHRDQFTTVGAFSFDEAWSHALVDALPALQSLRIECRQLKSREQRMQRGSPLTSFLSAAARRSLLDLHVYVSQNATWEQESAMEKLVSASSATLQELTLPDTDSFQIHQWVTCQSSQLIKLELGSFIERLDDLQCLGNCRLMKELTLSFDRDAFGKASGGMPDLRLALRKVDFTGAADTVFLLQKLCLGTELRSLQLNQCRDPDDKLREFLPSLERLENLGFWSNLPRVLSAPPQLQELALCAGEVSSSLEFTQALTESLKGSPVRRLEFRSMDSLTFKDCWQLVLCTQTLEKAIFAHFYDDDAECSARALNPERLVADCIEHPCLQVLELISVLHLPEDYPFPLGSVPQSSMDGYDAGMQYWAALTSSPHVHFHHWSPLILNDDGSVARDYVRLGITCTEQRSVTLIVRAD